MVKRRRHHEAKELELTTLLNIMVVLVSFLLLSAVFSKITIQELNMPPQGGGAAPTNNKPLVTIEVIVRKTALEIGDGKVVTDTIPKVGEQYDFKELSQRLKLLKDKNVDKKDVVLLVEPDIDYSTMISAMDAVKFVSLMSGENGKRITISLFPNVTVGDAP
jgi:biopolymer transport protein ExbD